MSAAVETRIEVMKPKPRLAVLPEVSQRVSTTGFLAFIAAIVVVGLGLVMYTTTTVGAQSRELQALRREATQLGYQKAALTTQLQNLSSPASLAMRASDLGMAPNPYPAFLNLKDGSVIGTPTAVRGNEMPWLRVSGPDDASHLAGPVVFAPTSTLPKPVSPREAG